MDDLLYLAHRIPYPPNKGDKIRSWNILRDLAAHYRVHLGCFVDDPVDRVHQPMLEALCASCHFASLNPSLARLRGLVGLLSGAPITIGYYRDAGLARWIRRLLQSREIRRIFVFSSSMAQYVLGEAAARTTRIIDFVDVDSDKWGQYARAKPWPASWIYGRESRTLLAFERRAAAAADSSLFVSEAEADLFRRLAPESADRVAALNNGVDLDFFDSAARYPNPFAESAETLVFTGAMDYWANVDAVTWFAREILPQVRARRPRAEFCIVGARPAAQVQALAARPGITVTGRVDDVRPYIAHAALVVAPLRLARGVQNKVLEAMAMARPVLATPEALEGIDAEPGSEVLCASGTAFAEATVAALAAPELADIGRRARHRTEAAYGWTAHLAGLKTILERPVIG
jgi:sugar transferase (PEP-CTERM/EpsH1 system associated)